VNNFLSEIEYCKIFFDSFIKPKKIYFFDASKDFIDENILKYIKNPVV